MSAIEIVRGETVIVGRADYGWGVEGVMVTVGGEVFIEVGGSLYVECGMCDGGHSGTKSWAMHRHGGVCYHCNGHGVHRKAGAAEDAVKIVKRRFAARARAERKREAAVAEQAAEHAAWIAANPEVVKMLTAVSEDAPEDPDDYEGQRAYEARWGWLTTLAMQAQYRALSEKQTAAAEESFVEATAEIAAAAEKAAAARTIGAVGDKIEVTGKATVATTIDTQYGSARLVVVEGSGEFVGVTIKAFGSGKTLWETERGTEVTISGTIKEHEEYEGVPQTVLTRAKVVAA